MPRLLYILLLCPLLISAKKTNLYISLNEFLDGDRDNYIEINFGIESQSLDYILQENGTFLGGLEITAAVYRDTTVVAADRFRILSPEYGDTSSLEELLFHQLRFSLRKGKYQLRLQIQDINDTAETVQIARPLQLTVSKNYPDHSQVIYLEDFKPSNENSKAAYQRSGFDLFPIISTGTPFMPESVKRLAFYNELYNIDLDPNVKIGETFLIKYYLKDESTGQVLNGFGGFSRAKAAEVNPLIGQIDISKLASGNYLLVVEAINAKGETVLKHENFFYRGNSSQEVLAGTYEDRAISGSWVDRIGNLDSMVKYVDYLYPISTEREQMIQENLLAEADEEKLKKYFYAFWQERKPLAPQEAWNAYHLEVLIANKLYTSGLNEGYKSDRGRVYLTYGKPSLVERRDMEPNMPPYIIWQYDNITSNFTVPQNNRIFVFGEFEPSTRIFKLIHSTAIGEISSPDWKQELYFRAYGGPGTIDPGNDPNEREFGSRANQNIIMGTTGADRRNR